MRTITVDTRNTMKENSWLEVGKMDDGTWITTKFRYPQHSEKLIVKREYEDWSDGNGHHQITHWTIGIPDDYKLSIAKVYRRKSGNEIEVL